MIVNHLDFETKGQLKNALLHLQTGILGATAKGQIFYDGLGATPSLHAYVHDGVAARKLLQDNDLSANADWTLETDKLATRATTKFYIDSLILGNSSGRPRGAFDASAGVVPTATNIKKGDNWRVTVAGTVAGISPNPKLSVGDLVFADIDNATLGTHFYAVQANFATAKEIDLDSTDPWGGSATNVHSAIKELWTKTGGSGGLQYLPLAGTGASAASKMTGPINWADDQNIYLGSNYVSNLGTALLSSRNAGATINMRLAVNQFPPNVQSADLASAWRGFAMDMSSDGSATIWANNSAGASTTSNTKGLMYGYDHTSYWNTLTPAQQENIIPSMKMVKSLIAAGASGAFLPLAGGTMTGTIVAPIDGTKILSGDTTNTTQNISFLENSDFGALKFDVKNKTGSSGTYLTMSSMKLFGNVPNIILAASNDGPNSTMVMTPTKTTFGFFGSPLAEAALTYQGFYHGRWLALTEAQRNRVIPDIEYVQNMITTASASRQTVDLTGDGVATGFNISHTKGTYPHVQLYDAISNKMIIPEEIIFVDATTVNITFSYAIAAGKVYKVSIF